jgi:hypothetical protein
MGDAFDDWGWRIPFLLSLILLVISVWIRLSLQESPMFQRMKNEGKQSKAPISESFGRWSNLKIVLVALFGATAGEAVVWYAGQFYVLFFLGQTLKVDPITTNLMIAGSLAIGTPFFIFFGWLSDKIGRKPILLAGFLFAALTYFPIFKALTYYANPAMEQAQEKSPVTVVADPTTCNFQFDPTGTKKFTSPCDRTKALLAKSGVTYTNETAPAGDDVVIRVGATTIQGFDEAKLKTAINAAGYPAKADPARINYGMVILLLTILVIYVTMVYGPIAAFLVELFPTRIRYTSLSLPYHIGNGWFGGFLPTTAFAMVAATGDIYYGLWYPVVVAVGSFIIGLLFMKETKDRDLNAEYE